MVLTSPPRFSKLYPKPSTSLNISISCNHPQFPGKINELTPSKNHTLVKPSQDLPLGKAPTAGPSQATGPSQVITFHIAIWAQVEMTKSDPQSFIQTLSLPEHLLTTYFSFSTSSYGTLLTTTYPDHTLTPVHSQTLGIRSFCQHWDQALLSHP